MDHTQRDAPEEILFTPLSDHTPGVLERLLARSYDELVTAERDCWAAERAAWRRFDLEAFADPGGIGRCVFVTMLDDAPVGFASFDPRQGPAVGIIGHNCVAPESRRRGIGARQIAELLRRYQALGLRTAAVSTSEHPFFVPAQRMYAACGFREVGRRPGGPDPRYRLIEYQREVPPGLLRSRPSFSA